MMDNTRDPLLDIIADMREDLGGLKSTAKNIQDDVDKIKNLLDSIHIFKVQSETQETERRRHLAQTTRNWGVAASIVATIISTAGNFIFTHLVIH